MKKMDNDRIDTLALIYNELEHIDRTDLSEEVMKMIDEIKESKNTVDLGNETITQIVDKYRKTNITNKDFSDRLTKAKTI